jgi:hypothetical protein
MPCLRLVYVSSTPRLRLVYVSSTPRLRLVYASSAQATRCTLDRMHRHRLVSKGKTRKAAWLPDTTDTTDTTADGADTSDTTDRHDRQTMARVSKGKTRMAAWLRTEPSRPTRTTDTTDTADTTRQSAVTVGATDGQEWVWTRMGVRGVRTRMGDGLGRDADLDWTNLSASL